MVLAERSVGESDWLQHGELPVVQEPVEVVRRASHLLPPAHAAHAQDQHLLARTQVPIQVSVHMCSPYILGLSCYWSGFLYYMYVL